MCGTRRETSDNKEGATHTDAMYFPSTKHRSWTVAKPKRAIKRLFSFVQSMFWANMRTGNDNIIEEKPAMVDFTVPVWDFRVANEGAVHI
jgi:hypothetical protein